MLHTSHIDSVKRLHLATSTTNMAATTAATPVVAPAAAPKASKQGPTNISTARTRRWLEKFGVNATITQRSKEIKEALKPYNEAKHLLENGERKLDAEGKPAKNAEGKPEYTALTPEKKAEFEKLLADNKAKIDELETESQALGRERARFNNEASFALTEVLNELVRQFSTHAMDNVLLADKKIIQVDHLRDGASKLDLFPLVHGLPSWHNVPDSVLKKKKDDDEGEEVPADADDSTGDKTSFCFYIGGICRRIIYVHDAEGKVVLGEDGKAKKSEKYGNIRVSTNIKDYINLLVTEFIRRVAIQLQEDLTTNEAKTVNDDSVMAVVRRLLLDGGAKPNEKLVFFWKDVPDPAAVEANKKLPKDQRKKLADLPKVKQYTAKKVLDYSNTRYSAIGKLVDAKLAEYKTEKDKKAADAKVAAGTPAAPAAPAAAPPTIVKEYSVPVKAAAAPAAAPAAPAAAPAAEAPKEAKAAKAKAPAKPKAPKAKADAPKPKVARAKKAAAK